MKKLFLLISIAICVVCYSCTRQKTVKEQLTSDMIDSDTFNDYTNLCAGLVKGIKSNRYNTAKVDRKYINAQCGGNLHTLPKKALYLIYSTAKMTNATEYIDTQLKIDSTYDVLLKEFPDFAEMSYADRMEFLLSVRRKMLESR